MQEPPFVVDVSSDRYFLDDHCANCLEPLPEEVEALFCSSWCGEIADAVRYQRRVTRDGRIDDPLVKEAVQIRNAFLLAGGYRALGRTMSVATRVAVKTRDGGKCLVCGKAGTEIDHIDGSSGELDNLQLLCADCHHNKTAENLVPASPEQRTQLMALFVARALPDTPILLADDEVEWQTSWRGLKKARKDRFLSELKAQGVEMFGMKTRAEMIEALNWEPDQFVGVTEDDDSGYGPDSYFARGMEKDDSRAFS
jgi:hypothetical protein